MHLQQKALTNYIYSKFCDLGKFMPKYKLVIVPSKCETVTEKLGSGVLLYSCFCLEFTVQRVKTKKKYDQILCQPLEINSLFLCRTVAALVCPVATPKTQVLWELSCREGKDHQKMTLV